MAKRKGAPESSDGPLTPGEAAQLAQMLAKRYADVVIDGSGDHIVITARGENVQPTGLGHKTWRRLHGAEFVN